VKLFDGGIRKIVGNALSPHFFDAVLTRYAIPASPARKPWDAGTPTETTFTCKALFEDYSEALRLDGTVKRGQRKVLILAQTLSTTPRATDKLTITSLGESAVIAEVATDPARACWTCDSKTA